ncbi:MAG: DMT family transporter [Proteobacteria bacterium]|nr:DMT family transporter [Pseudomonadota bacterium]
MERHRASGRAGLGFALAACTMVLWGMLPLALEALLERLDPVTLTWFRFGFSALALAPLLAWRRELPRFDRLGRHGWGLLLVATGFLAANYLSYLLGLDRTNAASAQVLIQAAPLLLALGGIAVFGERFARLQ